MSPWRKAIGTTSTALVVVIVLLAAVLGYVSLGSHLITHTVTATSTQTTTVVSQRNYTFVSTQTQTIPSLQNYTTTITEILIRSSSVPWNSSYYLSTNPGCSGPSYGPCFSPNLSEAVVFKCASTAATPQGCTKQVNSSETAPRSYVMTIWYPYVNHADEPSWANCKYSVPAVGPQIFVAYCISVSGNSFIVSIEAPPAH